MKHTVNCKFCQRPVTVEISDGATDLFNVRVWLSMAACNRCADYMQIRRGLINKVEGATRSLVAAQMRGRIEQRDCDLAKPKLEIALAKFCNHVCDHYMSPLIQDEMLMSEMMDHPGDYFRMLLAYERGIRHQNRTVPPTVQHKND